MRPDPPALRGIFLTMPLWPDTSEPTMRQIHGARKTVCLDDEADRFAALSVEIGGMVTVARGRFTWEPIDGGDYGRGEAD